ncbi:MAG: cell division protein FtsA [Terracidiphilus sp.]
MSQRQDNLIVALDVGSSSTRVLAAELVENNLRYCGHGVAPSAGMRKGLIAELGPAAKAVRAALDMAEFTSGLYIGDCAVGVGGPHSRGLNTNGGIELGGRMREIDAEDVRGAVERARAVERPPDREILHLLPRQFILDEQPGIFDPVGMVGKRLEVDLHIATCSGSALQSTVTCANRAGLEVTETIMEAIAAAESTLTADERELGVCLVDIGYHSSDLVVFFEGAVVHTGSIAIGGQHFTNDLAVGMQTTVPYAEELKRRYGNVVVTDVPMHEEIEIAYPQPRVVRRRRIAEILEARACELMQFVKENLRQNGVLDALGAGCVLTGGGSVLPGMLDVTESQLRVPARVGLPVRLSQMPAELVDPGFSVAVGMILYANRTRMKRDAEKPSLAAKVRAVFAGSF